MDTATLEKVGWIDTPFTAFLKRSLSGIRCTYGQILE